METTNSVAVEHNTSLGMSEENDLTVADAGTSLEMESIAGCCASLEVGALTCSSLSSSDSSNTALMRNPLVLSGIIMGDPGIGVDDPRADFLMASDSAGAAASKAGLPLERPGSMNVGSRGDSLISRTSFSLTSKVPRVSLTFEDSGACSL